MWNNSKIWYVCLLHCQKQPECDVFIECMSNLSIEIWWIWIVDALFYSTWFDLVDCCKQRLKVIFVFYVVRWVWFILLTLNVELIMENRSMAVVLLVWAKVLHCSPLLCRGARNSVVVRHGLDVASNIALWAQEALPIVPIRI